ncbi:hypothetical protein PENSPDRAFT_106654 [Peniophora sp. CONT]|nr:hypothetical protein PENSPDRAFT_106654 [Peniophora sp. CONT]
MDAPERQVDRRQPRDRESRFERVTLRGILQQIVLRFGTEDQDIIWRALATLCSWVIDAEGDSFIFASSTAVITRAAETTMHVIVTFLVLFMMWKLATVSRPLALSPDTIVIVDVLGEAFVLGHETFSTWESTHNFLLQAFQGRVGMSYVQRRAYGLGNSEHLLIGPRLWSQVVRSGLTLKMSVVVRERTPQCPYCRTARNGENSADNNGRIICTREDCGRLYYTHPNEVLAPLPPEIQMPGSFDERAASLPARVELISEAMRRPQTDSPLSETASAALNLRTEPSSSGDSDLTSGSRGRFQSIVVETVVTMFTPDIDARPPTTPVSHPIPHVTSVRAFHALDREPSRSSCFTH